MNIDFMVKSKIVQIPRAPCQRIPVAQLSPASPGDVLQLFRGNYNSEGFSYSDITFLELSHSASDDGVTSVTLSRALSVTL